MYVLNGVNSLTIKLEPLSEAIPKANLYEVIKPSIKWSFKGFGRSMIKY